MTTPTTAGGSGGQVPRKPSRWENLTEVTRVDQPDGSTAPAVVALLYGAGGTEWPGKTLKSASFSLSATGTVVNAVTSKRLKVYAVKLICSAAISVNFRDGAASNLEGAQAVAANSGFVESVDPPCWLFATAAGNSLDLVISGTGTAAGRISYWDDDAT